MKRVPVVDYFTHPAFARIECSYKYDDAVISEKISIIDSYMQKANESSNVGDVRILIVKVSGAIDDLKTYIKTHCDSIISMELCSAALEYVKRECAKEFFRLCFRNSYKAVECEQGFYNNLKNDGMHIVSFSKNTANELQKAAKPYYDRLKSRAIEKPDQRSFESVNLKDSLGQARYKMIEEAKILPTLSNYMRTELELYGVGIEYAFEGQTWYQGCYTDVGINETKLSYMHFDEASYLPKTLCYLTPVECEDNGATKYIRGSHKWERSEFLTLFHKGLDDVGGRYYGLIDHYYRPLYKHIELRKVLLGLPRALIGSSHIGDDILDDTELSTKMQEDSVTFLSDGTTAVVFDGGCGYHSGAVVKKGERLSLQIIYRGKNEAKIDMLYKNETPTDWIKRAYRTVKKALQNI